MCLYHTSSFHLHHFLITALRLQVIKQHCSSASHVGHCRKFSPQKDPSSEKDRVLETEAMADCFCVGRGLRCDDHGTIKGTEVSCWQKPLASWAGTPTLRAGLMDSSFLFSGLGCCMSKLHLCLSEAHSPAVPLMLAQYLLHMYSVICIYSE